QSTSFLSNVQSCGPSDLPSVGIFFIQSSWRPFLQNQQIGLVAVSLHSMVSHLKDSYISRCGRVTIYILVEFNKFLMCIFLMSSQLFEVLKDITAQVTLWLVLIYHR